MTRLPPGLAAVAILDGVVDEVGERLAEQFAVALTAIASGVSTVSSTPFSSATGS